MEKIYVRAAAVLAVGAIALVASLAGAAAAAPSPVINPARTNTSASGSLVVAVGDSIMAGHGLETSESWIAQLAVQNNFPLVNLASDGSGFVTAGDNNDTFADQIKAAIDLNADIVFLSGSSNDLGQSDADIEAATTAAVTELHTALPNAQIIAVSGVWGDTTQPTQMTTINHDVEIAVNAVGGTYLRIGQPLHGKLALMQDDDDHPTAAGQTFITQRVQNALSRAGIAL